MNLGYMQLEIRYPTGAVTARVHYDATVPDTGPQPLINGPRGYCLDLGNTTGANRKVEVSAPNGLAQRLTVGQGDPVKTRSLTAAQLAAVGITKRAEVRGLTING